MSRPTFRETAGLVALTAVAVLGAGCTSMQSYLDPVSPRLEGSYGSAPLTDGSLRVVTFNVEQGRKVDRAIAGLRSHPLLKGADVILLQEMDGPGVDQMARALGLNFVYFPGSRDPKSEREMGNAILSPWPLERPRKVLLPHPSRIIHRSRAAVSAIVTVGSRPIRIYSVHLGSPVGVSGGSRREQAEVVLKDAAESAEPVVIAGDFNSSGLGKLFVEKGYVWATEKVGKTVWKMLLSYSFDHVFLRGLPGNVTAGVAREVDDASDHRPVWTVVRP